LSLHLLDRMAATESIPRRLAGWPANAESGSPTTWAGTRTTGWDEDLPWSDEDVRLRLRLVAQAWVQLNSTHVSVSLTAPDCGLRPSFRRRWRSFTWQTTYRERRTVLPIAGKFACATSGGNRENSACGGPLRPPWCIPPPPRSDDGGPSAPPPPWNLAATAARFETRTAQADAAVPGQTRLSGLDSAIRRAATQTAPDRPEMVSSTSAASAG
jgi:hypothetical protein